MTRWLHDDEWASAGENVRFVELRVRRARASMRFWMFAARAGERLRLIPLLVAGALLFDAASPLPAMVRLVISLSVGVLFIWAVFGAVFIPARYRSSRGWAARRLEALLGARDNVILNAVQLASLAGAGGELQFEHVLARRSVERAADALKERPSLRAGDAARAGRAWGLTLVSLLVLVVIAIVAPRVVGQTAPRFFAPFGDYPPYSQTDFSFEIAPSRPLVGENVEVRIALGGVMPKYVQLVVRSVDDGEMARHDLSMTGNEIESVQLRALRRAIDVRLEGDTGWSRWMRIEPVDQPRVMSAAVTITAPASAGGRAQTWMIETGDVTDVRTALAGSTIEIRAVFSTDIMYSTIDEISQKEVAGDVPWESSAAGREARGWGVMNRVGEYEIVFDAFSHAGLGLLSPIVVRLNVVDAAKMEQEARQREGVASAADAMNGESEIAEVLISSSAAGDEKAAGGEEAGGSVLMEEDGRGEENGGEATAEHASANSGSGDGGVARAGSGNDVASGRLGEGRDDLDQQSSREVEAGEDESLWARFVESAHELTGEEGVRAVETMRAVAPAYRELTARYFWRLAQDDVGEETNEKE